MIAFYRGCLDFKTGLLTIWEIPDLVTFRGKENTLRRLHKLVFSLFGHM